MHLRKTVCATIVALVLVVAAGAAAKSKESRNLQLHYDATVAGSHLTSGSYDVNWQAHSAAATITFTHGSKVVATVEGKAVDHGTIYSTDQVVCTRSADGARALQ